nr:DNA-binding transcriptional regulator [uncultured Albidiferax sp.]
MHPREPSETPPYKEVRGLTRGLEILRALNRLPGGIGSTSELARLCQLDRTTTKRLLETLRHLGLVRPSDRDGQYNLTFDVRSLSEGFEDEAWVGKVARPTMQAAARELMWPCDLATAEAGFMVVRESTHRWSALSQHRAMIGERLPMLVTAIGRAYLEACDEVEREGLLELMRRRTDWIGEQARDQAMVDRLLRETRRRGYSLNEGEWLREADFAAIAVPVFAGPRLLAAINMVFPKSAIAPRDLQARYLPMLQRMAETIGKDSRRWIEA